VLHQLKRCLEDGDIIWHDCRSAPRARQPDFVIRSPCSQHRPMLGPDASSPLAGSTAFAPLHPLLLLQVQGPPPQDRARDRHR